MTRRWIFVTSLLAALALPASPAQAQKKPSKANLAAAKAQFEAAETHYRLQEYEQALDAYKESYRLSQQPELLFNIGQCYRKLGRDEEALLSYQAFLRDVPKSPNRAEVEGLIARTQENIAAKAAATAAEEEAKRLAAAEAAQREEDARREAERRAALDASQPASSPVSAPAPIVTPTTPEEGAAPAGRVWLGLGGAGLAGGLALGGVALLGARRASDLQLDGNAQESRDALDQALLLGNFSTGLCVAGAAGLVVGIVLGRRSAQDEPVSLVLSPRGAAAAWRF